MKRNICIYLTWLVFTTSLSFGQRSVTDFIDTVSLKEMEIESLDKINTQEIEFAPHIFENGLLFVRSNSEKKRIKKNEKIFFQLNYAVGDPATSLDSVSDFNQLRIESGFEGPVCYVPDRNWLFVTRSQNALFNLEERDEMKLGIYLYELSDTSWRLAGTLPVNNKQYNVCHPAWDEHSSSLVFASDMPGGYGKLDLYRISLDENGAWSGAVNLGSSINTGGNDCFPFLHDHYFLFYSSDRHKTRSGLDIYVSVKENKNWLKALRLPAPVNTRWDDLGLVISDDEKMLFFASSRQGGKGMDDIFRIHNTDRLILKHPGYHTVKIMDRNTERPIQDVSVGLFNFKTSDATVEKRSDRFTSINIAIDQESIEGTDLLKSNEYGELYIDLQNGDYIVQTQKQDFKSGQHLITIDQPGEFFNVYMDSIICKHVKLVLIDSKTTALLPGAVVSDQQGMLLNSNALGEVSLCLYRENEKLILIEKEDYQDFDMEMKFEEFIDGEEVFISMEPDSFFVEALPLITGEFTVLENIMYEFAQWELNDEAMKELDELVDHMLSYPGILIELSAHTDCRGGEVFNQRLSEKRANEAKSYLIKKGIDEERIAAIGYGESRLRNHCIDGVACEESEHALNRRTEVRVLAGQ